MTPHEASTEFSILMASIIKELQKNESENLETLKNICAFLTIKHDPDALLFSEDQQEAISGCEEVKILFRKHLRGCWRWDDFSLLKTMIQYLDLEVCQEMMSQYELKLHCKMKLQQIYEECKKENLDFPTGYHKLVAVVSNKIFSHITKEEYDELKKFITKHCEVNEYALLPFCKAGESSLILEWSIPSTAVSHMVEAATRNSFMFLINGFVFLKISLVVIFDKRKFKNVRKFSKAGT